MIIIQMNDINYIITQYNMVEFINVGQLISNQ